MSSNYNIKIHILGDNYYIFQQFDFYKYEIFHEFKNPQGTHFNDKRESTKVDTHVLNLARLITQEISLMKDPRNPRQAFERQSKLLRDAFVERSG